MSRISKTTATAFNPSLVPGKGKTAPVHDRRGPICNVVEGCVKLAHHVHGKWAACSVAEHKAIIFHKCRTSRAEKVDLPEISAEPEDNEEAYVVPERIG